MLSSTITASSGKPSLSSAVARGIELGSRLQLFSPMAMNLSAGIPAAIAPSMASMSRSLGMAMISLDLLATFDLSQHQALTSSEGRNHMDRCLGASLLKGTSQRLAINGHDLGWNSRQRGHPGYKTA